MSSGRALTQNRGALMLVLASALWGSSFVVIKQISSGMPAPAICMVRFSIAAIALLPFISLDRKTWRYGFELCTWLFAGYATQAVALRYTTVNRCAFITAMYVVLTPLLAAMLGHQVRVIVWAAAIIALAGCGLLCGDAGGINLGDLWSFCTAITLAVYIFRIEAVAARFRPLPLAVAQLVPIALFSSAWVGISPGHISHFHWPLLIYLGLAATAATTYLQAAAQQVVPAPQAAVIFSLDPVFAAIFGYLFLRERLSGRELIGAVMIIGAAVLCQVPSMLQARKQPLENLPDDLAGAEKR
jgi:drug/metabolite transporter (DMT)-like permease